MDHIIFLEKSSENLRLAEIAFENNLYNGCVNRAYYAMFQITTALLLKDGFSDDIRISHERAISLFVQKYCSERKIFPKLKTSLNEVRLNRNIADYDDQHINKRKAASTLKLAKEFFETITQKSFRG